MPDANLTSADQNPDAITLKWPEAEQGLAPAGLDVKRAKLPKKGTLPHRYRAPARAR
jgi:hypothetical protein